MRYGFVGSRDWKDRKAVVDYVASLPDDSVVVSGGAIGVDTFAEQAAKKRGLKTLIFKPKILSGTPQFIVREMLMARNTDIVRNSDIVIGFWINGSQGTADSLRKAIRDFHLPVRVFGLRGEIQLSEVCRLLNIENPQEIELNSVTDSENT